MLLAFGLLNTNPLPFKPSEKSNSVPAREDEALLGDKEPDALVLDDLVLFLGAGLHREGVGEPGAAAALYAYAQAERTTLGILLGKERDLLGRSLRNVY